MAREVSNLFMCLMGMGTVFVGLICIVLICRVLGMAVQGAQRRRATISEPADAPVPDNGFTPGITLSAAVTGSDPAYAGEPDEHEEPEEYEEPAIENHRQLIVAISVVLAEELDTDVSSIRILSFKQI